MRENLVHFIKIFTQYGLNFTLVHFLMIRINISTHRQANLAVERRQWRRLIPRTLDGRLIIDIDVLIYNHVSTSPLNNESIVKMRRDHGMD